MADFIGLDNNTPNVDNVDNNIVETTSNTVETQVEDRPPTDPNTITVRVGDTKAPIILLFGAPSSGKTMTLVRLARYLRTKKGYSIQVDPLFVTTNDVWEYAENSAKFNEMLNTTHALSGTGRNDFLFIKVCDDKGKVICQILEGAGEDYFPSTGKNRAETPFPSYMTGIFTTNNKKVWMFLTEPNWSVNQADRNTYVQRIQYCKNQHYQPNRDKCIILYNKVDKTQFVYGPGQVHKKNAREYCDIEYPGLFNIFKNPSANPFAKKYLCEFVPFSTGVYGEDSPGQKGHYDLSHDLYPAKLWESIVECIKG